MPDSPNEACTVKKLKEDGCVHTFEIEVAQARYQSALHTALLRLQQKTRLPGFRPGKAPLEMVRRNFDDKAVSGAVEVLIESVLPEAVGRTGVSPLLPPSISNVRVQGVEPVRFEMRIEAAPRFEVQGYKGLALAKKRFPSGDPEVESRLRQLLEGNARLETSAREAVEKSHYVVVDYDIRREGKPIAGGGGRQELVDMSADQSIAGLSEGLVGAKVGESREFPVQHEGRPAVCSVRVVEIKEKVLPALDDDFAKDVGAESLQALKARLQEIAAREAEERSERDLVRQMESALLESNKFPVPPALVESQLDLMLDRISSRLGPKGIPEAEMESLRGKLRPRSEEEVRLGFILSFVARKEGVEISDEDVEKEFQENLQDARTDEQRRDVREFFDKRRESIAGALRDRRVMALLRSSARISEVPA